MAAIVAFLCFTFLWLLIGAALPWIVPKGPNRGIIQTMIVETAVCCYLFWLCAWMMQLNPLIGPQLKNTTLYVVQKEWA